MRHGDHSENETPTTADRSGRGDSRAAWWARYVNPGQARTLVAGFYGIVIGAAVAGGNYWIFGRSQTVALSGILAAVGAMSYLLFYA